MESTFALGAHDAQLWTRDRARKIRGEIEKVLETLAAGDTLVIDAKGVEVFDYSFANELFGKILLSAPRDYPGRFVIIENLTKYTEENLAKALEGMGIAMIRRKGKNLSLLGKVHPADEATFSAIRSAGEAPSASQLAETLKVNINAINERLTKLTNLGVVRRQKTVSAAGREQYAYRVLE
jgi:hypothetical protein